MSTAASLEETIHEEVIDTTNQHESHKTPEPTRIIAIAVDSSKYSEYAFDWTINNLVRPESDQIILMNVRPTVSFPGVYIAANIDFSKEFEKIENANKAESHELLTRYAAKLPPHVYNVKGVAMRGDPRDEIAFKVEEVHADMLVIGSRGLGAFKKTFLGSVSDYLVHHLKVPVIVPRPSEL
ncbi:hypothetical protein HK100_002738 [Physocladia obscura]|uniref:UspA domain-containing protein n=1 Tax=Physocladia obscura TaxID=109957 RepID=A0AAD5T0Z0_9FUNG|nr:hypothetical protein HK100_002738 [Physocladia obscura]